MIRKSRLTTTVYLLLVFLSGAVVGIFAYRLYTVNTVQSQVRPQRSPDEYRRHYIERMSTRLSLSPSQVENLQQIMDGIRQRHREAHEKYKLDMQRIEAEQYQQIRAMLDATQQAEYEKMRAERAARRRAREKQQGSKPLPPR